MSSETQMQAYLSEVTDALLAGKDIEHIRRKYNIAPQERADLDDLLQRLNNTMQPVKPRAEFKARLKADLLDEPQPSGVLWQIRKLPARVQMAAIAALVGSFMLILQRRVSGEETAGSESTIQEQAR
jgi:type VI protein secretion system component VasF